MGDVDGSQVWKAVVGAALEITRTERATDEPIY
jgi:hypothetical protein